MGDSKGKSTPKKSTPSKQDNKTKSPATAKNSSSKIESSKDKNKKTPVKESSAIKKTPIKSSMVENKSPVKTDKKTPVKDSIKKTLNEPTSHKNTATKESSDSKKTPVKELSPVKKSSLDTKGMTRRREGLPISRVRTIMKTARYAEAISPDAVQLTAIATELFTKYIMKGVYDLAISEKKKKIDYNTLAKYVNNDEKDHLEFLRVLIPHKIKVGEYKKLMAESSKASDRLDFLASESEESESGSEEESEESGEEEEDSDSDIQEIPTPSKSSKPAPKTIASPKQPVKKPGGKVQTVDLCDSSSEDDFIIVDQKKNQGKGVKVL